jgi:hypothetical protein
MKYKSYLRVRFLPLQLIGWILQIGLSVFTINADAEGFINYEPANFSEHAAKPFFFSIGRKLKYGDSIRENAPTVLESMFEERLFGGELTRVYPAPDQKRAAIVKDGKLYLLEPGKPPVFLLEPVDEKSGYHRKLGDIFYIHYELQWDADSRYIFIPRDKKQKFPTDKRAWEERDKNKALMRIDIRNPSMVQEIIPTGQFRSSTFFLLNDDAICFNFEPGDGSIIWKCSISGNIRMVKSFERNDLVFEDGTTPESKPFMSRNINFYDSAVWLTSGGFYLALVPNSLTVKFFHKSNPDKPIFIIEGAIERLKGHFSEGLGKSVMLPGNRYAFMEMWEHNLLVDSETGLYKELPKGVRVYVSLNSRDNESSFQFVHHDHEGTFFEPEFLPISRLRTNYIQ